MEPLKSEVLKAIEATSVAWAQVIKTILGRFGIVLGPFWGHFGTILGLFGEHFRNMLGSFWDYFGPFWDNFGRPPSPEHSSTAPPPKGTLQAMSFCKSTPMAPMLLVVYDY